NGRAVGGHRLQVRIVDRGAETDGPLGVGGGVEGGGGRLGDGDLVDAYARGAGHDGEQLGEARADAGTEQRRAAALAGVGQLVAAVAEVASGDEGRRRNHVDARLQDPHKLVDVDPHRVVDDDVGLEGEQGVDVVGGGHPHRF